MNVAIGLMDGLGLDGDRRICVIPRQVESVRPAMASNETGKGGTEDTKGHQGPTQLLADV